MNTQCDMQLASSNSRPRVTFAIWFYAVFNVLARCMAAHVIYLGHLTEGAYGGRALGVVYAAQEPLKFCLMVAALPIFGALMLSYFIRRAPRRSA